MPLHRATFRAARSLARSSLAARSTKDRDGSRKGACQFERRSHLFRSPRNHLARALYASTVIIMTRVQQARLQAASLLPLPPSLPLSLSLWLFVCRSVCSFVRLIIIRARRLTPRSCPVSELLTSRALGRKWERASRVPKRSAAIIEIIRRRLIIDSGVATEPVIGGIIRPAKSRRVCAAASVIFDSRGSWRLRLLARGRSTLMIRSETVILVRIFIERCQIGPSLSSMFLVEAPIAVSFVRSPLPPCRKI